MQKLLKNFSKKHAIGELDLSYVGLCVLEL